MIYFLVRNDGSLVKIGHSTDTPKRFRSHLTSAPDWRFYAAICGSKANEDAIHEYFKAWSYEGAREVFHLTGEVKEYVEWLGTRAWAALSLDELDEAYPAGQRFPWDAQRTFRVNGQLTLGVEEQIVPGLRKPLSRSRRILATIRSDSDEWYTPPVYIEAARRVLGGIDLDPASCPLANQVVRADEIYTVREDGLRYEWHGRVWLNPPYGNEKDRFVEHLLQDYAAGRVTAAVMCLNAHATDTVWFQQLWEFPICFTHHRVRFLGGASNSRDVEDAAPTTGTAFVYVGPDEERFMDEFSEFGPIVRCARAARTDAREFRRRQQDGADWKEEAS